MKNPHPSNCNGDDHQHSTSMEEYYQNKKKNNHEQEQGGRRAPDVEEKDQQIVEEQINLKKQEHPILRREKHDEIDRSKKMQGGGEEKKTDEEEEDHRGREEQSSFHQHCYDDENKEKNNIEKNIKEHLGPNQNKLKLTTHHHKDQNSVMSMDQNNYDHDDDNKENDYNHDDASMITNKLVSNCSNGIYQDHDKVMDCATKKKATLPQSAQSQITNMERQEQEETKNASMVLATTIATNKHDGSEDNDIIQQEDEQKKRINTIKRVLKHKDNRDKRWFHEKEKALSSDIVTRQAGDSAGRHDILDLCSPANTSGAEERIIQDSNICRSGSK